MPFKGNHVIELDGSALLIDGPNNSGKSAVLDAIDWVITGRHGEEYEDDIIHHGASETSVVIEFDTGAVAQRQRSRGGPTRIEWIGHDGEKSIQKVAAKTILDTIGIDSDSYHATSHVEQGDVSRLATATDSERRSVLFSWITKQADEWQEARNDVARRRKESRALLADVRSKIETLKTEIVVDDPETEMVAINTRLQRIKKEMESTQGLVSECIAKIDADKLEKSIAEKEATIHEPAPEITESFVDEIAKLRADAAPLRKLLTNGFDGLCPFTGSSCPSRSHVDSHRSDIETKAESISLSLRELATKQAEIDERQKVNDHQRRMSDRLLGEIASDQKRLSILRSQATSEDVDLNTLRDHYRSLQHEYETLQRELESLRHVIKTMEKIRIATDEEKRWLLDSVATDAVVKAMDAVAGPAVVASSHLATTANELLASTGFHINLSWTRETNTPSVECECGHTFKTKREKSCPSCGSSRSNAHVPSLTILVEDGRVSRDIKTKSGGAKQLICLALRLAAATWSPVGWIILDEVDGSLTDENCDPLARMVLRAAAITGKQVIVVTHRSATAKHFQNRIRVVSQGTWSSIQ